MRRIIIECNVCGSVGKLYGITWYLDELIIVDSDEADDHLCQECIDQISSLKSRRVENGNLEEESEKSAKPAEDCTETANDDGGFN